MIGRQRTNDNHIGWREEGGGRREVAWVREEVSRRLDRPDREGVCWLFFVPKVATTSLRMMTCILIALFFSLSTLTLTVSESSPPAVLMTHSSHLTVSRSCHSLPGYRTLLISARWCLFQYDLT